MGHYGRFSGVKGTLGRIHPKSMTGYVNALKLRFEYKNANDEADADLEKVWYEGCIRDMSAKIQMFNDTVMVTSAASKKLILERMPQIIVEQMHMVDLTGKTNQDIIAIISNEGRTAEKCESATNNLGLKATLKSYDKKYPKLE
jgi:hypothetical protein